MSFVSIGDIDAVKQEFSCEFYLNVTWLEPKLQGAKSSDDVDWGNIWEPSIYFVDFVNYDIFERHQRLLVPNPLDSGMGTAAGNQAFKPGIPTVNQYYHIKGTFKNIIDVKSFPFDYQELALVLTSNWDRDKVSFSKDPSKDDNIRTWNFASRQEWSLQPHVLTEKGENEQEEGSSDFVFPLYKIKLHVRRKPSFYIYNVVSMMALLTLLTFSSFAVMDAGSRIEITLTLLLTSIAFKYYIQSFLPNVSYLTLLGKYLLTGLVFQSLMAVVFALCARILVDFHAQYDLSISFAGFLVYALFHVYYGCKSYHLVCRTDRKIKQQKEEYEKNNTGKRRKTTKKPFYRKLKGRDHEESFCQYYSCV